MVALWNIGGFTPLITAAKAHNIPLSIIPTTWIECINVIFMSLAWAVGYAGTPHILTKFMGIHNVDEMKKSQYIGLTWQVIVLTAAGLSGLLGLVYFAQPLQNKELVFIEIVKILFTDLQIGFILSAIAGAALSVVTAQALVLVSVLTEDLYKGTLRKNASEGELLWFYRCSIIIIACASFLVSYDKDTTIQSLVKYAWIGFGSSFSPLVLLALHSTYVNRYGAYASLITGGVIATLWNILLHHYIFVHYGLDIPAVIPGFILSLCLAYGISWATKRP
jgi:sodium/proline symporter